MRCLAILFAGMLLVAAVACSDSKSVPKETKHDIALGAEAGRRFAMEFSPELELDTLTMEAMLIDVRERETRLRNNSRPRTADAYRDAFLATLDSVNPSLAAELR